MRRMSRLNPRASTFSTLHANLFTGIYVPTQNIDENADTIGLLIPNLSHYSAQNRTGKLML